MDLFDQLPKFADLIAKSGVIGLLLIICAVLVNEVRRLRNELTRTYALRDKWRTGFTICKSALDFNKISVDLSQMQDVLKEDAA